MSENAIEEFLTNVVAICNQEESVPFICVIGKQLEGATALGAIALDHLKDEDIISIFKQMIHNYYVAKPNYQKCLLCGEGYVDTCGVSVCGAVDNGLSTLKESCDDLSEV